MQVVGTYTDGRALTYDEASGGFAIGGTSVTLSQVLEYDAFGQITWPYDEMRKWVLQLGTAIAPDAQGRTPQTARGIPVSTTPVQPYVARPPRGAAALVCPHCQTQGQVRTKAITQKKGVSGGKATAAVLTGGFSMLATGLSRKEKMTQARCSRCGSTWTY